MMLGGVNKKKKRWVIIEESGKYDPMERLDEDMMRKIYGCLDARSLAQSLLVSTSWSSLACSDSLWSPLYEKLLIGKAHIPEWPKVLELSKLAFYSRAITDSKRVLIMKEDLHDHAWGFHFTKVSSFFLPLRAAPVYWRNLDPYWVGVGTPMRRHFHPDGSVTADPEDVVWGGHECSYIMASSVHVDGTIKENYVRVNHWPSLTVSRREDWGWDLSNSFCKYSSAPDAVDEGNGSITKLASSD